MIYWDNQKTSEANLFAMGAEVSSQLALISTALVSLLPAVEKHGLVISGGLRDAEMIFSESTARASKSFAMLCEALITNLKKEIREVSAAKLLDTEDENMRLKKRIEDLEETLRIKEEAIRSIITKVDGAIARAESKCDPALLAGENHGNGS